MWNFELNNNGNSPNDIKERFIAVAEAARELENALKGLTEVFNGRNYQTVDDAINMREDDMNVLRGMVVSVKQIEHMSTGGAVKALRYREGL